MLPSLQGSALLFTILQHGSLQHRPASRWPARRSCWYRPVAWGRPAERAMRPTLSGASKASPRATSEAAGHRHPTATSCSLVDMTARIQVYDADGKYLRGLADAGERQRSADRSQHRQERPRSGARHSLLPRAGVRSRRHAGRVGDDRRRHGPRARRVRLGDRRGRGLARATFTSPNTATTTESRSSRPRANFSYNGAAPAKSQDSSAARRAWPIDDAGPHLGRRRLQPSHPSLRHGGQAHQPLGRGRLGAGRTLLSLRTRARRQGSPLRLRVRQPPRPKVHPRRQIS